MSTDYNYDEQGQFFPYFILTITSIITIPLTYDAFKPSKELQSTAPRIQSDYKFHGSDLVEGQKKNDKRKELKVKRILFSGLGWLLMLYMVYLIFITPEMSLKIWDPYEVLGVSRFASEKDIKRHYRKLSLTQHPDKVRLDHAKNQTAESVNERWVEISKAFKSLTDEEIRNNYLQYGHPDGKQALTMGIALPNWLVMDDYGKYTLAFYIALLGVFLPYVAGKWWYGTQRLTKNRILVETAGKLFKKFTSEMSEGDVITALAEADEFLPLLTSPNPEHGLGSIETLILTENEISDLAGGLSPFDEQSLIKISDPVKRKVLCLLWAYLGRVDLSAPELNREKFALPPTAWRVNKAFRVLVTSFSHTGPLISCLHVSQSLVQAIPPSASPLLQLPYFTPQLVRHIEGGKVKTHLTVQDYMAMPIALRKQLTLGPGRLTEHQFQTAMDTAAKLPFIHIEDVLFTVTGERFITPDSLVQLTIKFRFVPPGHAKLPEIDLNASEQVEKDEADERPEYSPALAMAPWFPRDHSPAWHVFLGEPRRGLVAVPPVSFASFKRPILTADGQPTYNLQSLNMQFGAPPSPGDYTFVMHMINDAYLGFDVKRFVTLTVVDASKAENMSDDEISEPGEDTLEGQMKALRSGQQMVDSDESDTEGEADADTSDTNTDTEDES